MRVQFLWSDVIMQTLSEVEKLIYNKKHRSYHIWQRSWVFTREVKLRLWNVRTTRRIGDRCKVVLGGKKKETLIQVLFRKDPVNKVTTLKPWA